MDIWMQELEQAKVIPVVKISSAEKAPRLAKALLQGGMKIIEVTFRTDAAAEAIRAIVREVPEMLVCAGTVLTVEQAKEAIGDSRLCHPHRGRSLYAYGAGIGEAVSGRGSRRSFNAQGTGRPICTNAVYADRRNQFAESCLLSGTVQCNRMRRKLDCA